MWGSRSSRKAILLALLMLFSGSLQIVLTQNPSSPFDAILSDEDSPLFAGAGDSAIVQLPGSGLSNLRLEELGHGFAQSA